VPCRPGLFPAVHGRAGGTHLLLSHYSSDLVVGGVRLVGVRSRGLPRQGVRKAHFLVCVLCVTLKIGVRVSGSFARLPFAWYFVPEDPDFASVLDSLSFP
jgi:hypothetical protein